MKEYIEREDAVKHLKSRTGQFIDDVGKGWNAGIEASICYIEGLPAPDVAEVVRCKDCQCYQDAKTNKKGFLICPASGMEITETDYCSYGARMDKEAENA